MVPASACGRQRLALRLMRKPLDGVSMKEDNNERNLK